MAAAIPSAAAMAATPDDPAARGYDVAHYDVSLAVDLDRKGISGSVAIDLDAVTDSLRVIRLDAEEIDVERVRIDSRQTEFRVVEGRWIDVALPEPLRSGERRRLTITYTDHPTRGVTFSGDQVYTQFHTHHWLPGNDIPADKSTLSLALDIPDSLVSVASGRLVESSGGRPGRRIDRWRLDSAYSPYLFGFAAGRFRDTTVTAGNVRVRLLSGAHTPEELAKIFASTAPALEFFTRRAGRPLPRGAYAQVLVRGAAAQELAGFTVIREAYGADVLAEPREDWLVAHELSHQWWGNSITPRSWSEMWLSEGMAVFMTAAYKEERWDRNEYEREMTIARLRYESARASGADRPLRYESWSRAEEAGGTVPYNKGALVLHMLRNELGDEAFWEGIRSYTATHADGVVVGGDLRVALERAGARSLERFWHDWVELPGVPDLTARHRIEGSEVVIELTQRGDTLREVPVAIAVETMSERIRGSILLLGRSETIRVPIADSLLSVRIDDGGYLPMSIPHERPLTMLLYQFRHEPDVAGRVDALRELARHPESVTGPAVPAVLDALRDASANDTSRLVRDMARAELAKRGAEK